MCTAVVGGSIHRADTRISAANDQRSTTPMTNHRTKDRRRPDSSRVLMYVFSIAVAFRNNSLSLLVASYLKGKRLMPTLTPRQSHSCILNGHRCFKSAAI